MTRIEFKEGLSLEQARYELDRLLGEGGFGATWTAFARAVSAWRSSA